MIDDEYIEGLLMRYADGELTDAERAEAETLLAAHPELREELETVAGVKVTPPVAVMPHKERLLHHSAPTWWRHAAAAAAMLAVSVLAWRMLHTPSEPMYVAEQSIQTPATVTEPIATPLPPHTHVQRQRPTISTMEKADSNQQQALAMAEEIIIDSTPIPQQADNPSIKVQAVVVIETDRLAVATPTTTVTEGYVLDAQLTTTPMQTVVRNLLALKE